MINASFDRSDPRDTTRGGVSLAPHAKSSMVGAGMRNTKARGSVDGLVRTETFVGDVQTRRRSHESSLPALRVALLTGKPSKESCANLIRHQSAIDNPQLL